MTSTLLAILLLNLYYEDSVKEFLIKVFKHPLSHLSYQQAKLAQEKFLNCNTSKSVLLELPDLYEVDRYKYY